MNPSADPSLPVVLEVDQEPAGDRDWRSLPKRAAGLYMLAGSLFGLPFAALPGLLVLVESDDWRAPAVTAVLAALLCAALGAGLGRLRWRHTFWKLDGRGLHVKRGRFWRNEILVPRSRVQHLDLERGPLERRRNLATLIVHTAGTRLHALRQSGFDDADAVALRDALVPEGGGHDDAV